MNFNLIQEHINLSETSMLSGAVLCKDTWAFAPLLVEMQCYCINKEKHDIELNLLK